MNECQECDHDEAQEVQVTYTTGRTDTLDLCEGCTTRFDNGGLVTKVVRTELHY